MIDNSKVTDALIAWGELKYREHSLGRDPEEREWQELGLFYQRRQWLEWKENERRYTQIKPSKSKPRPMPVSNYFANAINANANQLGSRPVRVVATPKRDDPQTRRSADYAEMAKDALDEETNLRLINPLLAKHTALWGIGVIKDEIDIESDMSAMDEQEVESKNMVGCVDCGHVAETGDGDPEDDNLGMEMEPCPECQSMNTMSWRNDQAVTASQYVSGKGYIRSRVCPIFEIFLPREYQNANLAPHLVHRYRRTLSKLREKYGECANDLKSDDHAAQKQETRMDVLRSLGSYNFLEAGANETATVTEVWTKWHELPRKLQDLIEDQYENEDPSLGVDEEDEAVEPPDPQELEEMKQNGLFFIYCSGTMLQWGPNPCVDLDTMEAQFPYTFFHWDIDPASVYSKGVGADLVPLQKRLNRLDSLIELGMMSNASGKWLWPNTQANNRPPNGDPSDVIAYDPQGDGKVKPEFVQPNPFSGQVWQYRASILQDFQQLGLTLGVSRGEADSGAAFRTVAYLGAKASEQLNTQRYLWESAHCLHYKKLMGMAKWVWDEERQVKVAGPNGKLLYKAFTGMNLRGMYEIDYVPDSSIPKTQQDKIEMMQTLVMGGLVNMSDPQTRQYVYDIVNMEGLNLVGERQFRKAERDLEAIKQGQMPIESPYQDWQIQLSIFANFTLTEEFEELDPQLQNFMLAYTEYINEKVSMINAQQQQQSILAASSQAIASSAGKAGSGKPADPNNKQLAKVPGVTGSPQLAESAAASQGSNFAAQSGA
jgi:Zn ribbon nucleic-acid-binding protein